MKPPRELRSLPPEGALAPSGAAERGPIMRRRQLLKTGPLLAAPVLLTGCQGDLVAPFTSWAEAQKAVLELRFREPKPSGAWGLAQTLQHLAQSIEYSMTGFPEPKSRVFQVTLGNAAFAVFDARGKMSHSLDEPIPGAPALDAGLSVKGSVQRLLDAMEAFAAFKGELKPHFAYGPLSREQYQRAHLMHLANHWTLFGAAAR
ncbi:DUF1569 domain-containing protein [Pelomonas sp. SE-A7]|uniref:DUF1569 domain-containing protein n=1 Tax=Pelomonas sp. SE-A7 TaxID=3054953 RepID=UPI00259CF842|nr:DUF1569 domain-containing protein [Pelomonas sp. SE-A7]MDM4766368.1 DUF1569 domain-containing protein [Pelomonas sp. SE-A7]